MAKVLIVDDTKNIRSLLTTCLEVEGYSVCTANNGKDALKQLLQEEYALVFLDIKLPEVSGTEVLRQLRGTGNAVPVVIMTAFATIKNAVECTKLGAVAYLQKPFTADKVRSILRECILVPDADQRHFTEHIAEIKKLIRQNRFCEAERGLKHLLGIDPECGEIYELLACIYKTQGNSASAARFEAIAKQFITEPK